MTAPRSEGTDRAQTLPDFVVGIAIMLVTLSFIVVFVPQLTLPFEDTEQPVVAERSASETTHLVTEPHSESELNETCTLVFFGVNGEESDDGCQFDVTTPLPERLGIGAFYALNVTLGNATSDTPNATLLCGFTDDGPSVEECETDGEQLAAGPPIPDESVSVATARRTVFVDEQTVILELVVW